MQSVKRKSFGVLFKVFAHKNKSSSAQNLKKTFTSEKTLSIIRALFGRGYSSAGRALAWHARGLRFDPAYLHHLPKFKYTFRVPIV